MPLIKLSKLERRRIGVLLLCAIGAVLAWFVLALNKTYPYTVETTLIYRDEPIGKAYKTLQTDTADLKVEGTGWQLLFAKLRISPPSIKVSLKKLNSFPYIILSEQLDAINRQLETQQKVISISPDTLFFDFSHRVSKRIPIKLISKISFHQQYAINGKINIHPSVIEISGTTEELEKIHYLYTDSLLINNVINSIDTTLSISKYINNNITLSTEKVHIKIPVDEFTEKVLEVPINIMNNINFQDIKLYPKKVKVTLKVPLKSYGDINAEDLTAVVDMAQWRNLGYRQLSVKVIKIPDFTKIIFIEPQSVDFLITN